MKLFSPTAAFVVTCLALSACADTGTYPISGDQCGPSDPVQTLDASDCQVPI